MGCIISYKEDKPEEKEYSLRYVSKVKKINPQTIDPAYNEYTKRKFILPEEFDKYCGWGENGEFQIMKALEAMNIY